MIFISAKNWKNTPSENVRDYFFLVAKLLDYDLEKNDKAVWHRRTEIRRTVWLTLSASRAFLLLARFWRSRKRLHESSKIFIEYALCCPEIVSNSSQIWQISPPSWFFTVERAHWSLSVLSLNGCSHWKNRFDERKQDWLVQKFGLRRLQRVDAIQAEPSVKKKTKGGSARRVSFHRRLSLVAPVVCDAVCYGVCTVVIDISPETSLPKRPSKRFSQWSL